MAYVIGAPDGLFRASGALSVKHAIACAHSFNIINRLLPSSSLALSLFERRKTNRVFPFEYIISKSYIHHATFRQNPTNQQNIASERATTIQVTIHEWARFFEKKRKTLGFEDFFPLGALGRSGGRLERSTLVDWNEEKSSDTQCDDWTLESVCPMHTRPSINNYKRTGFISFRHGISNSSLRLLMKHKPSSIIWYPVDSFVFHRISAGRMFGEHAWQLGKEKKTLSSYSIHENQYYIKEAARHEPLCVCACRLCVCAAAVWLCVREASGQNARFFENQPFFVCSFSQQK